MATRAFSIEDGQLNQTSIITTRQTQYIDVDASLTAKPNGDIFKKVDGAAVKQSVKNILLTAEHEKPFRPSFGAGLFDLLFDLNNDDLDVLLEERITQSIEQYEPRAQVQSVTVTGRDNNAIAVEVRFQIVGARQEEVLTTSINRLR